MRIVSRASAGLACFLFAWLVGFGCSSDELPEVVSSDDSTPGNPDVLFLVEVQARPDYRLVAYDPVAATTTPVFVIPEFGALASFGADRAGERLVLSYTEDYRETGTGLYVLDLAREGAEGGKDATIEAITDDGDLTELVARQSDIVYDDVQFDAEAGTVWATLEVPDQTSVVGIDVDSGEIVRTIDDAVEPAVGDGWVAFLAIESDDARRTVGVVDTESGEVTSFAVLDAQFDLGHLVADPDRNRVLFTALYPEDEPTIQIGRPAEAHGAHDGPSQWLTLDLESGEVFQLVEHEPMAVRDATMLSNGQLAASGIDGVVVVDEPVEPLIESRYITELAS
ncbi:MAG: hypothetical protein ACR2QO_22305 [Acidimicrobiales bacterium]